MADDGRPDTGQPIGESIARRATSETSIPLAYSERDSARILGITEGLLARQRRKGLISYRVVGGSPKTASRAQTGEFVYEMIDLVNYLRRQVRVTATCESEQNPHKNDGGTS
jgi:hypothetical protein